MAAAFMITIVEHASWSDRIVPFSFIKDSTRTLRTVDHSSTTDRDSIRNTVLTTKMSVNSLTEDNVKQKTEPRTDCLFSFALTSSILGATIIYDVELNQGRYLNRNFLMDLYMAFATYRHIDKKWVFLDDMAVIDSSSAYAYTLKLLVLGDGCVGKSNVVLRLTEDRFDETLKFTIGLDFKGKDFVVNRERIRARILDTAGQERFHSMTPSTYRNLNGVAIVFSVTNMASYSHVQNWLERITDQVEEDIPIILLGNMNDRKGDREVSHQDGKLLAQQLNLQYFEVSAKTGKNVHKAFQYLVTMAYLREKRQPPIEGHVGTLKLTNPDDQKSKMKCCNV
ncbi:hypothetical protein L596_019426 [Steinernema carpocapsae]|uniref:Uncharacterized protein n=1 Tax=Steinernema carpocapsae TaxID=34508 RepID=A0A4U5MQM1_STECR|nr:hypothetical protein L596_019426 [Steinernema carpocapsae]